MKNRWKKWVLHSILGFGICVSSIGGSEEKRSITADSPSMGTPETRLEYARVLTYSKKYDEAIQEYQKLLKENPNLIDAKIELARVYYYEHSYDKATALLDTIPAKDLTPDLTIILADIFVAQKDYPKAEEFYQKALKAAPDNDVVKFKIAELLSWQKRYDESIPIFKELLVSHPEDIQLRRKYAMVLLWSGNDAEAAEELKKTLQ